MFDFKDTHSVQPETAAVGFVGAGSMGQPMICRLLRAGAVVSAYVRRPDVADQLRRAGATVCTSLAEAVHGRKAVFVCLFDEQQLRQVVLAPGGLTELVAAGTVVVVHTTASPRIVREVAGQLAKREAHLVEAPISGTASDILEGRLTVLAAGDTDIVASIEPLIRTYASQFLPIGELGTASTIKLVNNLLFAANAQLAAEAISMSEQLGIPPQKAIEAIAACSGASEAMCRISMQPSVEAFDAQVGRYLRKDARAALSLADDVGVPNTLLRHVLAAGQLQLGIR